MTLTEYRQQLQNTRVYPDYPQYIAINNHKYKIELEPDTDCFAPTIRTLLFDWNERYSIGDYHDSGADDFLYNFVEQNTTPDVFAKLREACETADNPTSWCHILQSVPNVIATRLCVYEHSSVTLYRAPSRTDPWDTRCTVLAVYQYDNTLPVPDNVTIANQELDTYCKYFNGEVYTVSLLEPVTVTHTRTYIDGRTDTNTEITYERCVTVCEVYDPPVNVLEAYNLLARYSDDTVVLTPPTDTPKETL